VNVLFPRLVIVPPRLDAAFLGRKLLPLGQAKDDPEMPFVAVATGIAASGGLELQRLDALPEGGARRVIAEAETNAAQGPRSWTVAEKSGIFFKKPSLLRAYGDLSVPVKAMTTDGMGIDDLSSDLLLDATFMTQAAKLLRGEDLIAAIPKRGWLLVGLCRPGELHVMVQFRKMAEGIAGRGGRHALTAACFFVRGGELRGISGDGYLSMVTDPANPWNG
jgi:hypothetical protein